MATTVAVLSTREHAAERPLPAPSAPAAEVSSSHLPSDVRGGAVFDGDPDCPERIRGAATLQCAGSAPRQVTACVRSACDGLHAALRRGRKRGPHVQARVCDGPPMRSGLAESLMRRRQHVFLLGLSLGGVATAEAARADGIDRCLASHAQS